MAIYRFGFTEGSHRGRRYGAIAIVSFAITIALVLGGCDAAGSLLGIGTSDGYSTFQQESLKEMNFLRTDPVSYAEARLADDYASGTDNGAYADVRARAPVGSLTLHEQLGTAASDYAEYMAKNDVFGHYERLTPAERSVEVGYEFFSGENLAAGSYAVFDAASDPEAAAVAFVEMLVIDEGVLGVGHRENLLSDVHRVVGIGFHRDTGSTYHNYYVQDFGRE